MSVVDRPYTTGSLGSSSNSDFTAKVAGWSPQGRTPAFEGGNNFPGYGGTCGFRYAALLFAGGTMTILRVGSIAGIL